MSLKKIISLLATYVPTLVCFDYNILKELNPFFIELFQILKHQKIAKKKKKKNSFSFWHFITIQIKTKFQRVLQRTNSN
jgi:hypothetical protein